MHRIPATVGVALGAAALALGAGASASASSASGAPLLIHEQIQLPDGPFTFTAAEPLCPSGTFADTFVDGRALNRDGTIQQITLDTVYTCDAGSGTIEARKVLVLLFHSDGSESSTGTIHLTGGTGDYAGIRGQGTDTGGANTAQVGSGTIRGGISQL